MAETNEPTLCPFCGQQATVEVFEVWSDNDFLLDTCCEAMHEMACEGLRSNPREAARWIEGKLREGGVWLGDVRRVADTGDRLVLDWSPTIALVSQRRAKEFVAAHHRHCKPPAGWRFGAGVLNGSMLVAVVMVGRPVARMLDASRVVEVNRLCVRTDVPRDLVWNVASMLYGWAAREAKKRGFEKIITYTLESEVGTTLRAAGWTPEARTRAEQWGRPSRRRADSDLAVPKIRWSRELARTRRLCGASAASGQQAATDAPASWCLDLGVTGRGGSSSAAH